MGQDVSRACGIAPTQGHTLTEDEYREFQRSKRRKGRKKRKKQRPQSVAGWSNNDDVDMGYTSVPDLEMGGRDDAYADESDDDRNVSPEDMETQQAEEDGDEADEWKRQNIPGLQYYSADEKRFGGKTKDDFKIMSRDEKLSYLKAITQRMENNDPSLTAVELWYYEAGDLTRLADLLKRNFRVEMLTLRVCKLGAPEATAIATALEVNSTLKFLDLTENPIGDGGAGMIAKSLDRNSTLQNLLLRKCKLTYTGGRAIAEALLKKNCPILRLSISGNEIKDAAKDFISVVRTNGRLKELLMRNNKIGPHWIVQFIDPLLQNTALTKLSLDKGEIPIGDIRGVSQTKAAGENTRLKMVYKLNLKDSRLNPADIVVIASLLPVNHVCREIDLSDNVLGRAGVYALAKVLRRDHANMHPTNTRLERIKLGSGWLTLSEFQDPNYDPNDPTSVTNRGDLDFEKVGLQFEPIEVLFIAALLKTNKYVRKINLRGSTIDNEGLALARLLNYNDALQEVLLTGTLCKTESINALVYVIKKREEDSSRANARVSFFTTATERGGRPAEKIHKNEIDYHVLRKIQSVTFDQDVTENIHAANESSISIGMIWVFGFMYFLLVPFWILANSLEFISGRVRKPFKYEEQEEEEDSLLPLAGEYKRRSGQYFKMFSRWNEFGIREIAPIFNIAYFAVWWPFLCFKEVLKSSSPPNLALGCICISLGICAFNLINLIYISGVDTTMATIEFPRKKVNYFSLSNFVVILSCVVDMAQLVGVALNPDVYHQDYPLWKISKYTAFGWQFDTIDDAAVQFWVAVSVTILWVTTAGFIHFSSIFNEIGLVHLVPRWEDAIYFFSNTLFSSVCIIFVKFMDCHYAEDPELVPNVLVMAPSVQCFVSESWLYTAFSVVCLILYVLSATFVGSLFYDNISPALDLQLTGNYMVTERAMKFCFICFLYLFDLPDYPAAAPLGGLGCAMIMLWVIGTSQPTHVTMLLSIKAFVWAVAGWTLSVALAGHWMWEPKQSYFTVGLLFGGWGVAAIIFIFNIAVPEKENVVGLTEEQRVDKYTNKVAPKTLWEEEEEKLAE